MKPQPNRKRVNASNLNVRHRKSRQADRVSNGTAFLPRELKCTDGRGAWQRRIRSLLESHVSDLGGWDVITAGEAAILRRAVVLCVELERREALFATSASIDDPSLAIYMSGCNRLNRLLTTLGLERRMRDTTPSLSEYLAERARQGEQAEQVDDAEVIDASVS